MKRQQKVLGCICMILVMIFTSWNCENVQVIAATQQVMIEVSYGQSEARSMLAMINGFRTSETEAWCWNESDTAKEMWTTTPIVYDYDLEKAAMLRAKEIAIYYSHVRPNGQLCSSVNVVPNAWWGENIAAGQDTASEVFEDWKEENRSYIGQGHRRNMLDSEFVAVGIGHVVYQGMHYWVQEFSGATTHLEVEAADNSTRIETVDIDDSNIQGVTSNLKNIVLSEGEEKKIATPELVLDVSEYFGYEDGCGIKNPCQVRVEDTSLVSYADNKLKGLKAGTTRLIVSNPYGSDLSYTVTVNAKKVEQPVKDTEDQKQPENNSNLGSGNTNTGNSTNGNTNTGNESTEDSVTEAKTILLADVESIPIQNYTGYPIKPKPVVRKNGVLLVENVDYTLEYDNNVLIGRATIWIHGIGTYKDSIVRYFLIDDIDGKEEGAVEEDITDYTPTTEDTDTNLDYMDMYDDYEEDATIHTTKIKLNKTKVTLKKGKKFTLKVSLNMGSVDKIKYSSSNKKIATVSSKGVIKAKKKGTVKITVKSGSKKKVCTVKVK